MSEPLHRTTALRATVALLAVCSLLSISRAQPAASPYAGSWRGVIVPNTAVGIPDDDQDWAHRPHEFIINISKDWTPRVDVRESRDLRSAFGRSGRRPLSLTWALNRVGEEGVVIYGHAASPEWAETQVFTIARSGEDALLVQWWRVVNNVRVPPEQTWSKWALGGQSEFTSVGRRE